ncbi:MAG: cation diffusion facilitator family transporter [Gammaproteobacteria bacterium]|nr:cation diffusion facilitator family transporter [Gammaproteobacteria bacterium]
MSDSHGHERHDSGHGHEPRQEGHHHAHGNGRGFKIGLGLTLLFAVCEALAGLWAHSLALLSDAGHMFSDTLALGLSLFAAWLARRPPSARHSYGFVRTEILAALANGLILLAVVTAIAVEAIARLQNPRPVAGFVVMLVATGGIIVNIGVVLALSHEARTLNTRSAILHVLGDLVGSAAALMAGAVIYYTGWMPIDPILSLVIGLLILYSTLRLLREVVHILMEGVPEYLDLPTVGRRMAEIPGIVSVHDLHIWTLSSGTPALSAHVVVGHNTDWMNLLAALQDVLLREFGIAHVTVQPEILNLPGRPRRVIPIHQHV